MVGLLHMQAAFIAIAALEQLAVPVLGSQNSRAVKRAIAIAHELIRCADNQCPEENEADDRRRTGRVRVI